LRHLLKFWAFGGDIAGLLSFTSNYSCRELAVPQVVARLPPCNPIVDDIR